MNAQIAIADATLVAGADLADTIHFDNWTAGIKGLARTIGASVPPMFAGMMFADPRFDQVFHFSSPEP